MGLWRHRELRTGVFVVKTILVATCFAMLGSGAANATIVNISGTANGEQTGGADCNVACEGALISPVQVTFAQGTYNISDAYSPTTGLQSGASYDAWNFEAGNGQAWVWHWKALLDDGQDGATINVGNYASHILLDVDAPNPADAFTTEAQAAAFGAATPISQLTFTQTTTVDFVVNDYYLPDNAGGVSLDIESASAAPEPATWGMMLFGFAGLGFIGHRRAKLKRGLASSAA